MRCVRIIIIFPWLFNGNRPLQSLIWFNSLHCQLYKWCTHLVNCTFGGGKSASKEHNIADRKYNQFYIYKSAGTQVPMMKYKIFLIKLLTFFILSSRWRGGINQDFICERQNIGELTMREQSSLANPRFLLFNAIMTLILRLRRARAQGRSSSCLFRLSPRHSGL